MPKSIKTEGETNERRFSDHIRPAGRAGNLYFRHEHDEWVAAKGGRGKDEEDPGDPYGESGDGGPGRNHCNGGDAEQQCHDGHGHRVRQCRVDDFEARHFRYSGSQYRDHDDSTASGI